MNRKKLSAQVSGRRNHLTQLSPLFVILLLLAVSWPRAAAANELHDCLVDALSRAEDDVTVGQLRLECQKLIHQGHRSEIPGQQEMPVVSERVMEDREHALQPFTLMAHKPNYLLVASYNSAGYNAESFKEQFDDPDYTLDDVEAKFQLSIKFPLLVDILDTADIYAAHTNRSFWQVYNTKESSPFRETNHEPEIWVQFNPDWGIGGFTNTWNSFGFNHQSNGRDGTLSRSWNRLFAWITFERDNLAFSFKPWYAIVDEDDDGDNPDITDYLGHYELSASCKLENNVFSIMSRNNLESGFKRGALELSWSFPLFKWPYLKRYVQYLTGYGESLIDYNQYVNTIGLGLSLTDWL
jgi:phospholipase A1